MLGHFCGGDGGARMSPGGLGSTGSRLKPAAARIGRPTRPALFRPCHDSPKQGADKVGQPILAAGPLQQTTKTDRVSHKKSRAARSPGERGCKSPEKDAA